MNDVSPWLVLAVYAGSMWAAGLVAVVEWFAAFGWGGLVFWRYRAALVALAGAVVVFAPVIVPVMALRHVGRRHGL